MKKFFAMFISVAMVVIATVSGTLAYLTVDAESAQYNVFTIGNIKIELTEEANDSTCDSVTENLEGGYTYSGIMPGDYLQKEVTVSNTGKNDAYVAVTVLIKNDDKDAALLINNAIDEVYEAKNYSTEQIQAIYDYIFDGWGLNYSKDLDGDGANDAGMRLTITGDDMPEKVLQVDSVKTISEYTNAYSGNWFENVSVKIKDGVYPGYYSQTMGDYELCYTYYMLLEAGSETTLFNGFNVPASFNADQLKMFDGLKIDITASAIQADNFNDAKLAFTTLKQEMADGLHDGDIGGPIIADTDWYDDAETTFTIRTAAELKGLSELVYGGNNFSGKTVYLADDINLENTPWTPIGRMINTSGVGENSTFKGDFDGQGHTIYNLYVDTVDDENDTNKGTGLFGAVTGNIKNLNIKNATIKTAHWAGAIAGNIEGDIIGCSVENVVIECLPELIGDKYDNGDKAGAIVGYATKGIIKDCSVANVEITGYRDLGAVAGASYNNLENVTVNGGIIVKDSTNDYKGTADDTTVNKIVGTVYGGATLTNVTGEDTVEIVYPADIWDSTVDTSWYNDTDTEFALDTAEQIAGLAELVDGGNNFAGKTIKLDRDIDLASLPFNPIGHSANGKSFNGTFDGQRHTISNMYEQSNLDSNNGGWLYEGEYYGLFAYTNGATIKNVTIADAYISSGRNEAAGVVGNAVDTAFSDITISNTTLIAYNNSAGGVAAECYGNCSFTNIVVDEDTVIGPLWGTYDVRLGGVVGLVHAGNNVTFSNITVACQLDAINDVAANYQYWLYRYCGMLIGHVDGVNGVADPTGYVTCENVKVVYGDWVNYHYCEDADLGAGSYNGPGEYKYARVEAGTGTDGIDLSACNHNADESHNVLIVFDQLFGGGQGVEGLKTYDGVTVIYN